MDDLTLLRDVRAGEPGPSATERDSARNALLAAIETSPPGRRSAAGRSRPARWLSGPRRIWLPAVAATAAFVIGAAAVMLSSGPRPARPPSAAGRASAPAAPSRPAAPQTTPVFRHTTLSAAFVLSKAAAAAARQATQDGRFFFSESEYITSIRYNSDPRSYREGPALRRFWLGNGTSGRLADRLAGRFSIPPGVFAGASEMTWAQVRDLPTAPGPLLAIVATQAAGHPKHPSADAFSEFDTITSLLFESPTSPAVAAALYRLAAALPGIKVVDTTDLVGRSAIEVYLEPGPQDPPGWGQALFFSPVTDALLGWAQISTAGPQCPVYSSYAILATGYVSSTHQRPRGTPSALEPAYFTNRMPGCPSIATRQPASAPGGPQG